jgi:hypothetical protein
MQYPPAELLPSVPEIEAWLVEVTAAAYLQRRCILKRMREAKRLNLPRFLYRFQSLRRTAGETPKIMADSLERLRVPIVESLLHLQSPERFNDPFDMGADFQIGGNRADKIFRYRSLFEKQNPRGKLSEREAYIEKMLNTPPEQLLPGIRASYRSARRDFGLVCFAGGDDPARNVLMWSHYGAEHSGLCLQFDPARDVRVFHSALHVDYSDTYPVIDYIVNFQKAISASLLRKHTRWLYEQEHRISRPDQAGRYLQFHPEALSGIIFGCRASAAVEEATHGLLAERYAKGLPRVRVLRAKQNPTRYELDIVRGAALEGAALE